MKIVLIYIVFSLHAWSSQGQNNFATCKREWTKIGCYQDRNTPSRLLPEMLLNDRDRYSKYHQQGYLLNWHKWKESIHSLACRCAERALQKGYNYFGLQFYGECWSGPFAEFNYSRAGVSDRCIMNLKKPTACVQAQDQECVGQQLTNYIYKLTSNPGPQSPDVDGGYSQWSQWSNCSKSCGIGRKFRERTCTNPRPQGNGKSCRRLGWPDDSTMCFQECNNCDKVMDIGIIIDSSSSVRRGNYEKVKAFLIQLVDKMHISYRMSHVAVIRYNHRAYLDWNFNAPQAKNSTLLKAAILKLRYQPGGTRTDRALEKAGKEMFNDAHGQRPNVPHVLLVITDGKTSSRSKPYPEVQKPLKDQGVEIIAIGVGQAVDSDELTQIAMGKLDKVVHVNKTDELVSKLDEIVKADTHEGFCSRSMLQDHFARVSTHEGALFAPGACSQVFNRLNIVAHFAGWKFCSRG